ncbi:MAG: DUF1972 domain-containing protein [Candidatus Omnitrophica bacterium]|nr:DUF1972 domain-containing protein [Candidatus Omnitrophota bacterium]
MKIALIGTRGVPAKYGGFETCAEELALGLVRKGHRVLVSCRRYLYPERQRKYEGVELCYPPSLPGKISDTFSHTFFSLLSVIPWQPDAILVFNAANSPLCLLPRLLGFKVAINVDGLEWKRKKWGRLAKAYYRLAEFFSCLIANEIVADAKAIADYYWRRFHRRTVFIPYGAHLIRPKNPEILSQYGLRPKEYLFIASRLEPENHQDLAVAAFQKTKTDKLLVIAGGANWNSPYVRQLLQTKDPRIRLIGPVYASGHIEELHCHAYAYIHGNEVGGTNPALLKAMGCGNCILALDVPFNREVLADTGLFFSQSAEDLQNKLNYVLSHPEETKKLGEKARERVSIHYRWEDVVNSYQHLFSQLA